MSLDCTVLKETCTVLVPACCIGIDPWRLLMALTGSTLIVKDPADQTKGLVRATSVLSCGLVSDFGFVPGPRSCDFEVSTWNMGHRDCQESQEVLLFTESVFGIPNHTQDSKPLLTAIMWIIYCKYIVYVYYLDFYCVGLRLYLQLFAYFEDANKWIKLICAMCLCLFWLFCILYFFLVALPVCLSIFFLLLKRSLKLLCIFIIKCGIWILFLFCKFI